MRFSKYHGIGNDFIMLADPEDRLELDGAVVRALCDRRFGIGGDGVIRVAPGREGEELFMDYVNSDGSVGEMCGNGIRCLAVFALEEGLTTSRTLKVGTRAGLKVVDVHESGEVTVDMGAPAFAPADIPVTWEGPDALHARVDADGETYDIACVSIGNPHAVMFVDDVASQPVTTLGPRIENHAMFPNKTNVEFVHVASSDAIDMRVWERGSGETLACGTGACAVAVVCRVLRDTNEAVDVRLPGGVLRVEWTGSPEREAPVLLTGPATKAFEGEVDLDSFTSAR